MGTIASDDFNRASLGANWVLRNGTWNITSNALARTTTGNPDVAHWASTFSSADQKVAFDMTTGGNISGAYYAGVCARRVDFSTSDSDCYLFVLTSSGANAKIFTRISGSFNEIASSSFSHAINTAYNMRLECEGTAIRGYIDDVLGPSVTDSALSAAGDGGAIGGTVSGTTWDDFLAEDFAVAGAGRLLLLNPPGLDGGLAA